jgi:hypothetical protein
MQPDSTPKNPSDSFAARLGGAASGLLAGLFVGVLIGGLLFALGSETSAGWMMFVCLSAGTVAGYLSAAAGLDFLAGIAHFFIGVLQGFADQRLEHSPLASRRLRWMLYAGFWIGLLFLFIRRWW